MQPDAIFIRHAESTGNKDHIVKGSKDYPVNAQGRKESTELATKIARYKPTVVLTSPLKRAQEPAQKIARAAGVKMKIDKGLLPPDMGKITGESQKTGEPKVRDAVMNHPDKPIGGTGSVPADWLAKQQSMARRVNVLITSGERPAVVTHSRNLRELPHSLFGGPVADPTKGGPEPSGYVLLKGKKLETHKGAA